MYFVNYFAPILILLFNSAGFVDPMLNVWQFAGGMSPTVHLNVPFSPIVNMAPFSKGYGMCQKVTKENMKKFIERGFTEQDVLNAYNLASYSSVPFEKALSTSKQFREEEQAKIEKNVERKEKTLVKGRKQNKQQKNVENSQIDFELKNQKKMMKTVPDFKRLVDEAMANIEQEKQTFQTVVQSIDKAIGSRKLVSIRMIGMNTMAYHEQHYDYKDTPQAGQYNRLEKEVKESTSRYYQTRSVYQNAFCIKLLTHLKERNPNLQATTEDLFLTNVQERQFLKNNGIRVLAVKKSSQDGNVTPADGHAQNLLTLPKELVLPAKGKNEATLVIMFSGTIGMTLNTMHAYGGRMDQVILVESELLSAHKDYPVEKYPMQHNTLIQLNNAFDSSAPFPDTKFSQDYFDGPETVIRTTAHKTIIDMGGGGASDGELK